MLHLYVMPVFLVVMKNVKLGHGRSYLRAVPFLCRSYPICDCQVWVNTTAFPKLAGVNENRFVFRYKGEKPPALQHF